MSDLCQQRNSADESRTNEQRVAAEAEYARMIQQVTRGIVSNNLDQVLPFIGSEYDPQQVELFADGNFEKRIDVLLRLMPFVSEDEDFPDFEDLAIEFCQAVPVFAYQGSSEECAEMLKWMEQWVEMTPAQRDTVRCQQTRYDVEFAARNQRAEHIAFQERVSLAEANLADVRYDDRLKISVNPLFMWSEFESDKFLEPNTSLPAPVLYWADDEEVRTSQFEERGIRFFNRLCELQPCPFSTWAMLTDDVDCEELFDFLRQLVELRLVAIY